MAQSFSNDDHAAKEPEGSKGGPRRTAASEQQVVRIPVIEETLSVEKRNVQGRTIRLEKSVDRQHVAIDEILTRDEVEIERRPVGRVLGRGEEPSMEQRDGVTVIPVIEERVVIQRVLTEEIHLRRSTREDRVQEQHELRRERVEVGQLETNEDMPAGNQADGHAE